MFWEKGIQEIFKKITRCLKSRETLCKTPVANLILVKVLQIAVFTGISKRFP